MPYESRNPATEELLARFETIPSAAIPLLIEKTASVQKQWASFTLASRCDALLSVAKHLSEHKEKYARLMSVEMGKRWSESLAEVDKCADLARFYAAEAGSMLGNEPVELPHGRGYVCYPPLGTVLGVMPWNYPFWQVFRFAVPALLAGNACLLKHAANVPQCAQAIEEVFVESGLPEGVFRNIFAENDDVDRIIAHPSVRAISFTGSETVGRLVAATAGQYLKKSVLELGGSDPWIVLADADISPAVDQAIAARFINAGQACTAAKRMIVVPEIADEFVSLLTQKINAMQVGDPFAEATNVGPMARKDLRDKLNRQVAASIATGAEQVSTSATIPDAGYYYAPVVLDHVPTNASAYFEELFGPVATILRANDEADALRIANDTRYGLGAVVWSKDIERAERFISQVDSGMGYVNGQLRSNNRLPFGGVKASGYGRELSRFGLREFTNIRSVWIRE
ncbi:NAD-dependent succinate-semialdehyde dehydrogenase [Leeia sp. TBRC 13508]|uniref:NAD-dependent succinate-semialdehyde dehydrogenase n=1 Tax=Leeia speluncae TaxID=2884804 RepID=A0ABS8D5R9_9NEIS|nr:NAD-dependent succinate-semialdehyde dehydrogenase [Leeia speluncae]MCB6183548.1 NAD-dependent succinate-semialdehyde dehydrogenase [Leeia speluncae]